MLSPFFKRLLSAAVISSISAFSQAEEPRNVILIIGDGMDDHQITIARNYLKGVRGKLTLDEMPVRGAVQVLTVREDLPNQPVYVADSANSATSIATGHVTSRGRIGTSAKEDKDLKTIAEFAKEAGYKVGIVSTANVTDATPASFISHINQRGCENPQMMVNAKISGLFYSNCSKDLKANGGLGSISEQIAVSDYDIILGGGQKHFQGTVEGGTESVGLQAINNGFHVSQNPDELDQLPSDKKVLGIYSDSHLAIRLQGEGGRLAEQPQPSLLNRADWRLGEVEMPASMSCETNPEYDDRVSLKNLTEAALKHLNGKDQKGFFLMVESASIDKQSHKRNPCGSIGELQQLEESVQVALEFAEQNANTLVMVTADHGQAAQLVPATSLFAKVGVPIYTPGHVARIKTPENAIMAVNYATNEFPLEEHTGVNVPIFANEVGRREIAPVINQPDIFMIMMNHLNLTTQ